MKHLKSITIFLALVWILPVQAADISEYRVKSAYLFNFAKFVEWPAKSFGQDKDPLVIGVLGEDPFGDSLDKVVEGKIIGQHPITVLRFDGFDEDQGPELRKCQVLFIAYSEKKRAVQILNTLRGSSVLTVSEIEKFPLLGGMILFDQVGKRIGLVVNLKAVKKAGLGISAKLLQVSRIYKPERSK